MRKIVFLIFLMLLLTAKYVAAENNFVFGSSVSIQCYHNGLPYTCGTKPSNTSFLNVSSYFSVAIIANYSSITSTTTILTTSSSTSSSNSGGGGGSGGGSVSIPTTTTTIPTTSTVASITPTSQTHSQTTTNQTTNNQTTNNQTMPTGFATLKIYDSLILVLVVVCSAIFFLILKHFRKPKAKTKTKKKGILSH